MEVLVSREGRYFVLLELRKALHDGGKGFTRWRFVFECMPSPHQPVVADRQADAPVADPANAIAQRRAAVVAAALAGGGGGVCARGHPAAL